jgi:hypothetical protein
LHGISGGGQHDDTQKNPTTAPYITPNRIDIEIKRTFPCCLHSSSL